MNRTTARALIPPIFAACVIALILDPLPEPSADAPHFVEQS